MKQISFLMFLLSTLPCLVNGQALTNGTKPGGGGVASSSSTIAGCIGEDCGEAPCSTPTNTVKLKVFLFYPKCLYSPVGVPTQISLPSLKIGVNFQSSNLNPLSNGSSFLTNQYASSNNMGAPYTSIYPIATSLPTVTPSFIAPRNSSGFVFTKVDPATVPTSTLLSGHQNWAESILNGLNPSVPCLPLSPNLAPQNHVVTLYNLYHVYRLDLNVTVPSSAVPIGSTSWGATFTLLEDFSIGSVAKKPFLLPDNFAGNIQSGWFNWIKANNQYTVVNKCPYLYPPSTHSTQNRETSGDLTEALPISVYPNPTNGEISIDFGGEPIFEANMFLYNIQGSLVGQKSLTDTREGQTKATMNLSDLPAGMYFLKIHNGEKITTHKIIKE